MGETADLLNISSANSGIDIERLAALQKMQQDARASKAFSEFYANPSLENFSKNPLGILTELTMESLVAMYYHGSSRMAAGAASGATLGSVIPGAGTAVGAGYGVMAGMGLTSLNLEYAGQIIEGIAENGYDITSAQSLKEAFSNEELINKLKKDGLKKGIPVALFDMLSMGVAGKIITKPAKSIAGKVLAGVAELGVQAVTGMGGEATGQLVLTGKIKSPSDILMEGLGELGPGVPEIAFGAVMENAKNNEPPTKKDLITLINTNGIDKTSDDIDVMVGTGQISSEQGDKMKGYVQQAGAVMSKMPSEITNDSKAKIMDLIEKRNDLLKKAENLDDVFKKEAEKLASDLNNRIIDIANTDIQQKQKEYATQESKRTQQEGLPEGGKLQYQGIEGQQAPKADETNLGNRPVSSTEEVKFQKAVPEKVTNVSSAQTDEITNQINSISDSSVQFQVGEAVGNTAKSDVNNLVSRPGLVAQPKVVKASDFVGKPIMVTISDELTTGDVVNPATGNIISGLQGGIGFNYTNGNTGFAWAYTDEATAQDTLNTAKQIYSKNPELYPDGIVPVAVVKMGTEAINSNEAIFRVLLDNVNSLPKKNLTNAYKTLVSDINNEITKLEAREKFLKASGKSLSPSERNALNGYRQLATSYLKENKSIPDVVKNISQLNINTRPLITNRITSGEVGLLTDVNRLRADKPVTKALMEGLGKEDIKKIHLGWIAEPLRDPSIKNVPARHVIGFVGIDAKADNVVKSGHPNYPFALNGMGLGVLEDTVHLASVMPTAYGNAVKKITDAIAKGNNITPAESISRAMPSGLANAIFKGKNIEENQTELSKLIGFLNLSFPNVTFFTDQQSFDDISSSPDVKKYVREGEIIYGLTTDGKIYLNPSIATANTAIHEMGHIWVDYIQNSNPELFNKGLSLVEGTAEFEKAKKQLGDNLAARKEALAMLIGNRGETITTAAQKSKFKEWLVAVWKYLQEQFPSLRNLKPEQIEMLSLEQFLGGAVKDILSGNVISDKPEEYVQIGAAAQKMSDIVPFEPQLPEGPKGPEKPGEVAPTGEGAGPVQKKKYDWESFQKEGKPIGEQMIKTSTGRYVATETMRGQIMDRERTLKEIDKTKESWYSRLINETKVGMLDNQMNVLRLLDRVGKAGQIVKSYLMTRNSASTTAMALADAAVKDIYGPISKKKEYTFNGEKISEYVLFNQVISYQRVISIQQQMNETYQAMVNAFKSGDVQAYNKNKQRLIDNGMIDENGEYVGENLETEFGMGQVTATQATKLLNEIRSNIGEENFDKLMTQSKKYSDYFNSLMRSRMEAGLISEDTYSYLSRFFYAPTRYISSIIVDPILSMSKTTTSYAQDRILKLKSLAGGSERLNVSDYEGLLKAVTYASEYSIAENRATNRFFNLVDENTEAFENNGIRLGIRYIPIEEKETIQVVDDIDRNVKMITEGKKPMFGKELSSGQKQLPFKGIEKAKEYGVPQVYTPSQDIVVDDKGNRFRVVQVPLRAGEAYIKTYENGQRKDIIVPAWFAEAWNNDNFKSSSALSFIGKITGSNLLRLVATGINPVFGIAQLIPDTISAYAATIKERGFVPLLVDYPVFFAKTLAASRDITTKSKDYLEANKYGATTNFYNGGSVTFERGLLGKEDTSLEKIIESWNIPGLKQYVVGSKKITETTEQMTKVALYKSIKDAKIAQYKAEFEKDPTGQALEDIKIESGYLARSTADFHRKGTWGSELNKIIPYLNAAIQVQRAVLGSAKQNKTKALYYSMEFLAYSALLWAAAAGAFDDDETKERKRKALSRWSDFDRTNRIPLVFVESKNKFISVKLPEFLTPFNSIANKSIERGIIEKDAKYTDKNFSEDLRTVTKTVIDEFPVTQFVNIEKVASRNPMYSAMSKLFWNRDPYRQEEVVPFEEMTKDYLEGTRMGEQRAGAIYQAIGKGAISPVLPEGISPKRLEAAANSIPFENNPFSGIIIFGTELATSDKKLFEERYGKGTLDRILKASGISQRYFKEGSKINQTILDLSVEEIKDRGEFMDTIKKNLTQRFDSYKDSMSRADAWNKVKDEYLPEFKKLDPEQQKMVRSYIFGDLSRMAELGVQREDPMVSQIISMQTADAKIDAIIKTLNEIKQTDSSKTEFIKQLVDAGLVRSSDMQYRLNERGMSMTNKGNKNPYAEPEVEYIRNKVLEYIAEKRAKR